MGEFLVYYQVFQGEEKFKNKLKGVLDMAKVRINMNKELVKLIHRPVYKDVVCYTHSDSYEAVYKNNSIVNHPTADDVNIDFLMSNELKGAAHKYYNSPTNIRRIYITYRGVVVLYYTSFIENGVRSTKGHWILRSFPASLNFKEILSKMISYDADRNKYFMERAVNKKAKEPIEYSVSGGIFSILENPWVLGNIEEIYFDWVSLMCEHEGGLQWPNGMKSKNVAYQFATNQVKPQIIKADYITSSVAKFRMWSDATRKSYPRLRTVTFISNLGDILFNPQMPFDKVDSEFNDISKAGVMWYRAPQNVEIFKQTGSVVWYHDFTEGLKVRNKEFKCYPGIYLFDEKYLGDVFESYKQKIDDYNRKLQYGDKAEEETKEEEKAQEESNVDTDLEDLVQRLVKQYGTQTAIYILRIAATGYQSKDIHEIVKSVSEKNQIQMKKYLGVN